MGRKLALLTSYTGRGSDGYRDGTKHELGIYDSDLLNFPGSASPDTKAIRNMMFKQTGKGSIRGIKGFESEGSVPEASGYFADKYGIDISGPIAAKAYAEVFGVTNDQAERMLSEFF